MTKVRLGQAAVASILFAVLVLIARLQADEGDAARRPADLVKAARDVFDVTKRDFEQGRCVIEDVHLWSERLMKAEQSLGENANAAADHSDRMRKLYAYMEDFAKTNPARGARGLLSAKYYRLEAEANEAAK